MSSRVLPFFLCLPVVRHEGQAESGDSEPAGTVDEVEAGRILRVTRSGYRMRDRLLRPATVVVSTGPVTEGDQTKG